MAWLIVACYVATVVAFEVLWIQERRDLRGHLESAFEGWDSALDEWNVAMDRNLKAIHFHTADDGECSECGSAWPCRTLRALIEEAS